MGASYEIISPGITKLKARRQMYIRARRVMPHTMMEVFRICISSASAIADALRAFREGDIMTTPISPPPTLSLPAI